MARRTTSRAFTPGPAAPRPATIKEFLDQQQSQDLLRFITCGSVDDGKSTLIGRLLWESQQLFDDQLASLKADSKKYGTQGSDIDFVRISDHRDRPFRHRDRRIRERDRPFR